MSYNKTVCDLIAEQVLNNPECVAATYQEQTLTYQELEERSNQLANYISYVYQETGQIIGLCIDRSLEMVVCMLAILKSNAAYLPLDPTYPDQRLHDMLQQANAKMILSHSSFEERFIKTGIQVLNIDEQANKIQSQLTKKVTVKNPPQDLAYVIFTSGSTGRPKGVMIRHESLVNLLLAIKNEPGIAAADHMLALTTIAFDIAGLEIWLPLISGARVTIAPSNVSRHAISLANLINTCGATIVQATPSTWQMLVHSDWKAKHQLKILCGGERMPASLADALLNMGHELWNVYGPTETTIWSTVKRIHSSHEITVGRPIANTEAYILDERLQPVAAGQEGELYLGGAGLALGYINQPELTQSRFIPHPYSLEENAKLYKTGDRARILPNGEIDIIGRNDDQVKINGHRIELNEIENRLMSADFVKSAVVMATSAAENHEQLTAYIVLDNELLKNTNQSRLEKERVEHWGSIYSDVYRSQSHDKDLHFNTSGWNSSYTKEPIPQNEMQEWVTNTIQRIKSIKPQRILEIGCGSGLLLSELAGECKQYVGVDVSNEALKNVSKLIQSRNDLSHVELYACAADQLQALELGTFDLIVINSVVQYFPSIDYLINCIQQAVEHLDVAGRIFIGDVRDLGTIRAFYGSVLKYQTNANMKTKTFKDKLILSVLEDEELVISPKFFTSLSNYIPEIKMARVLLKQGRTHNELNCFRYDVILEIEKRETQTEIANIVWYDWSDIKKSGDAITNLLAQQNRHIFGIKRIANRRLTSINQFLAWLDSQPENREIKQFVSQEITDVDPAGIIDLATYHGYEAELYWNHTDHDGAFDVVFYPRGSARPYIFVENRSNIVARSELHTLANNPMHKDLCLRAQPLLREHLLAFLPVYMVPSNFIFLDKFPLTLNLKIDKKSLPQPIHLRMDAAAYIAPSNELEAQLVQIWEQALGVNRISVTENFFALGGDSIRSMHIATLLYRMGYSIEPQWLFKAPTIKEFAALIAQSQSLTEALADTASALSFVLSPLSPNESERLKSQIPDVEDVYPLSPMQSGILYGTLKQADTYLIQGIFTITSCIEINTFTKAWQNVIANNPILRTGVIWENYSTPFQYVRKQTKLSMEIHDWSADTEHDQRKKYDLLLNALLDRGVDITLAPQFNLNLIQYKDNHYDCVLTCHHLIVDGWCLSLIMQQVMSAYGKQVRNENENASIRPYRDYISWLNTQDRTRAKLFWQDYLKEFSEPSVFQFRQAHRASCTSYELYQMSISKDDTDHLTRFAKAQQVTINTLLQVAWSLLLNKYTQRDDVVFGVTISGRSISLQHAGEIVGPFINTIPVRVKFDECVTLKQLLTSFQNQTPLLLDHAYLGLSDILKCASLSSQSALFDSILVFENEVFDLTNIKEAGSFTINTVNWRQQTEYPLTLGITLGNELSLRFTYQTNCFESGDIKRLAENFAAALMQICTVPEQVHERFSILSDKQWRMMTQTWNATDTNLGHYKFVHQLFEEQVALTPNAVAVSTDTRSWTYAEVNAKANHIAHLILAETKCSMAMIAVAADRSYELLVSMLGILKAGSTYVILDTSYPPERLQFILNDIQAPILLTEQKQNLSLNFSGKIISVDSRDVVHYAENPDVVITPTMPAYVMYTSGSTGQPKGVINSHQGILNRLLWTLRAYPISLEDNFLQLAAVGFDISFWEMIFPLSAGASLHIAAPEKHKDIEYVAKTIAQKNISILHFVPSLLELFLEFADMDQCRSIKQVVCGGELLTPALRDKFFKKLSAKLHHAYGPTEAAISVTHYDCDDRIDQEVVPIGKPIANTQLYILDKYLSPVPINTFGELYISGICLADGYLHRPDLTNNSFVPHIYRQNEKMYKTGDIASYLPDGNIVFLGRKDNQVKLYGHRIELGEIESALRKHSAVRDVIVMIREDVPQHKYLAAYVLTNEPQSPKLIEDLRSMVSAQLPDYMLPGAILCLQSWPLTPNGKVDRKALPAPNQQRPEAKVRLQAHTAIEKTLSLIWSRLFGLSEIAVDTNFFALGGDSILSIQLVSLARQHNINLSIKDIFRAPTIAGLAALAAVANDAPPPNHDIQTHAIELSPIQKQFFEWNLVNPHHFNQNVILEIDPSLSVAVLEKLFSLLIKQHPMLSARFSFYDNQWNQTLNTKSHSDIKIESEDLSNLDVNDQETKLNYLINQTQSTFNIFNGLIWNAKHFYFGPERPARLFIAIHHLCVDNVSWDIILGDIDLLLQQVAAQQPLALAVRYPVHGDWSQAFTDYSQIDYWLAQKPSQDSVLPIDYRVDNNQVKHTKKIERRLAYTDVKNFRGADIQTLLLTAFAQAYCEWAGGTSLFTALEGHGREGLNDSFDLTSIVGWFTSVFPVNIHLDQPSCALNSVRQVKEYLQRIPMKGAGFGFIKELKNYPKPQISFNYNGQRQTELSLYKSFRIIERDLGTIIAPNNERQYVLEVESYLEDGIPHLSLTYPSLHFKTDNILRLVNAIVANYSSLIAQFSQTGLPQVPSDFALCELSQHTLDTVFANHAIENIYPLSPTQAGILFQTQLDAIKDVYFVQSVYLLDGQINLQYLYHAWMATIAHHPILRTGFIWESVSEPLQFVAKQVELPWKILDWTNEANNQLDNKLNDYLLAERKKPFDLTQPPLLRLTLIKLTEQRFYMIWTQHHVLLDGWCLSIILRDVLNAYQALSNKKPIDLPYYPPYANYIAWLKQTDLHEAKQYWCRYLHGLEKSSRFQLKLGNGQNQLEAYGHVEAFLSAEETRSIFDFVRANHFTLNTLLQCAWGLLLSHYLDADDIIFGVTQSGRSISLSNVDTIIGLFINTLPLRMRINTDDTTLSLLARMQDEMSDIYQYSSTPLAKIPSWIGQSSQQGLFDTLFVFENYPFDHDTLNQFQLFSIKGLRWIEKTEYPLTITVLPGECMGLSLSYQTAHFDDEAIHSLISHLRFILKSMLKSPKNFILDLPKLNEEQLEEILLQHSLVALPYPHDACLHELIERQVALSPHAIAVTDNQMSLSYQQLNSQANQLANEILSRRLPHSSRIAVCLDRNIDMVVALLAIMKTRAAYVPLDPDYPDERMFSILDQVAAPLLISHTRYRDKFARFHGEFLSIDEKEKLSSHSSIDPKLKCEPSQLLYLIFTSGSTGKPKGVMISHRNVVNFLTDMQTRLQITKNDKWLSVTTITFDIAGLELYLPLISGAQVIIADREQARDVDLLRSLLVSSGSTIMQATPATWRMLVEAGWKRPPYLQVLTGGEALPLEIAHALNPKADSYLWNLYGPTETTIWSMAAKLFGKVSHIHLGKPIANTRIYILDKSQRLIQPGMIGEIAIAGDGLAQGYWNQPEMTAERFIEIQLDEHTVEKVYRTGDLGRYLADGTLEYLGRSDYQIKLHGYRIELGEIETYLAGHHHVKQAVVVSNQNNGGDYLVAHVTTSDKLKPEPVDFSLFFFSAYQLNSTNPYHLIMESVKFADHSGFKAVWTPERHFHEVGGQFPNPAVLSAALAAITKTIHLRAGSVVLPLHHPARVAEEWSLVDNLSNGRVGIAFASGWNPKDFAFYPHHYEKRREIMQTQLQQVQLLWQGGAIDVVDGNGKPGKVQIYPRPKQQELPIWITAAGSPQTFIEAGRIGANVLTHLLGQSIEALAEKIRLYRQALQENGFKPESRTVTIMLHAFVCESTEQALAISKQPFCNYLKAHISLESMAQSVGRSHLVASTQDEDELITAAFERYSKTSALIGCVEDCLIIVKELKKTGVNEIACLIDFGIAEEQILANMPYLAELMRRSQHIIELDSDSLRTHLRQHLPEFMLPQVYIAHNEFPLTFNGKIDRKQLAAYHAKTTSKNVIGKAPSTETELSLAKIWREVLNVAVESVQDNFFHLGGHSLLATQAISRIRNHFNVDIPLRTLFELPTIAEFSLALEAAGSTKQAKQIKIEKAQKSEFYPLSFSQLRSWYLHLLEPNKPLHNTLFIKRFQGDFSVVHLQAALQALMNRHPMLRMSIRMQDEVPVQIIHNEVVLSLKAMDLSCFSPSEQQQRLSELQLNEITTPFDLHTGPLIRAHLVQMHEGETILLITQHHIITDGWSRQLFLRDLLTIYNAKRLNQSIVLPDMDVQYVDFAVWQRKWITEPAYLRQLEYWQTKLTNLPEPLRLPRLSHLPDELDYHGKTYVHQFSAIESQKLRQYANQHGVTLFMLMLSVFNVLLHRYSDQDDIVVGTPIANRNYPGVENILGFFVNTLALRVNLAGNPHFSELLARVRSVTLEAYDNQDVPFDQLIESLNIQREPNRHPVFQIMFAMQEVGKVEVEQNNAFTVAQFDLTVSLQESEQEIRLQFDYATAIFSQETVIAMARHFECIVLDLLDSMDKKIGELQLLTLEEKQQIHSWNNTAVMYSEFNTIVDLVRLQAQSHSDAIAVCTESDSITYDEINAKSNQIARYLLKNKVQKDDRIAVCLDRSIDYITIMLGIMKAGATYVPLDPSYPSNRLEYVLNDTNACCLLIHSSYQDKFINYNNRIICFDSAERDILREDQRDIDECTPDDQAYVIYTSGTTGKPKGVPISHRDIMQRLYWCQSTHSLGCDNKFLHLFSFVFDGSVISTWWPLCFGSTILLADKATITDAAKLSSLIQDMNADVIFGTPSILRLLPNELAQLEYNRKLCVISGGEKLSEEIIKGFVPFANKFYNFYGPTECTVMCMAHQVDISKAIPASVIGKPIANSMVYILDKYKQQLPIGVVGELYIGGKALSDGYLNLPELTQDKFVTDPFSAEIGARMYKTGDFGMYLQDGSVDYVERRDRLVKLRGFRIELDEINAVILNHPSVRSAHVCLAEANTPRQRIVAFIESSEFCIDLKYLASHLPEYMCPSSIHFVEKMPLTIQGKIDESALLKMMNADQSPSSHYRVPRSISEFKLLKIWQHILELPNIDINDNFFALGGNSLLIVKIMTAIKREFNRELPLNYLFKYPSISLLAKQLDSQFDRSDVVLPIQTEGNNAPLIMIHPACGVSFAYLSLSNYFSNQPIYALSNPKFYESQNKFTSIEEFARYYADIVMTQFPAQAIRLGGWSFGGLVAYEMAKHLAVHNHPVEVVMMFDTFNASHASYQQSDHDEHVKHLKELNIDVDLPDNVYYLQELIHNEKLAINYQPNVYDGKVVLFTAENSTAAYTWENVTHSDFTVLNVGGSHHQMFSSKYVFELSEQIKQVVNDLK